MKVKLIGNDIELAFTLREHWSQKTNDHNLNKVIARVLDRNKEFRRKTNGQFEVRIENREVSP